MANRRRDAERESFWRGVLARHAASGLSVAAFCRREKLSWNAPNCCARGYESTGWGTGSAVCCWSGEVA